MHQAFGGYDGKGGAVRNVKYKIEGEKLIIEVDINQSFGLSGSGKSIIVASTGPFVQVDGAGVEGLAFGLNVTRNK